MLLKSIAKDASLRPLQLFAGECEDVNPVNEVTFVAPLFFPFFGTSISLFDAALQLQLVIVSYLVHEKPKLSRSTK